jgi:hypothetical protein
VSEHDSSPYSVSRRTDASDLIAVTMWRPSAVSSPDESLWSIVDGRQDPALGNKAGVRSLSPSGKA